MKRTYMFSRLFAEPSALEGAARLLDLGTTLQEYNASHTEAEADTRALANDWRAVGEDMMSAIRFYETETATS